MEETLIGTVILVVSGAGGTARASVAHSRYTITPGRGQLPCDTHGGDRRDVLAGQVRHQLDRVHFSAGNHALNFRRPAAGRQVRFSFMKWDHGFRSTGPMGVMDPDRQSHKLIPEFYVKATGCGSQSCAPGLAQPADQGFVKIKLEL